MKNIARIIKIAKPIHRIFLIITLLIVFTSGLEQVSPLLSKFIVDEIVKQVQSQTGNITKLITLIGISFGVNFIATIITSISNRFGDHLSGKIYLFLTNRFYDKIFRLPLSYFDTTLSGQVLSKLSRGIYTIRGFFNMASNFMLPTFLQSLLTIAILAYYNIPTAIFIAALFPIYYLLTKLSTNKWGEYEGKKNKIEDKVRGRVQEVIANMKVVKSFRSERSEYTYMDENLSRYNDIYAKQSTAFHKIDFLRNLSLQIILIMVTIVVSYGAFRGTITIGEMVLIIQLVNLARRPLFAMSYIMTQIQEAESGSKGFLEILNMPSIEEYEKKSSSKQLINPEIRFDNVSFAYEENKNVLNNISFTITKKQKVALVGHSGAGKSTLVNLILKLYEPSRGTLYLDNKSYQDLNHAEIRDNIAFVLQDNELFSLSIRDNVKYGNNSATENEIVKALKQANAYDFVIKLKRGLDSEVGEKGVRLSGGQKQRIQIARAILKNAPILILDEATSNLDSKSEKEIQQALSNLMKERLVIIIAHRFSTIQNVDRILVINNGRIEDTGTPQELAKKPGVYSDLLQYQIEGNRKLLKKYDLFR